MAFANDVDVINAALLEIGEDVIVTRADLTNRAIIADSLYDDALDTVLAAAYWKFAKKYTALSLSTPQPLFMPVGFVNAYDLPNDFIRPVRLEDAAQFDIYSHFATIVDEVTTLSTVGAAATFSAAHNLAIGDFVYLDDGSQEGEIRRVTAIPTGSTATLAVAFTADQVAGTNWIRATGSKNYIITDASPAKLEYVSRITNPVLWDSTFRQAFITYLKSKFSMAIVHSRSTSESYLQEYLHLILDAQAITSQDNNRMKKLEDTSLVRARRISTVRSDKVLERF